MPTNSTPHGVQAHAAKLLIRLQQLNGVERWIFTGGTSSDTCQGEGLRDVERPRAEIELGDLPPKAPDPRSTAGELPGELPRTRTAHPDEEVRLPWTDGGRKTGLPGVSRIGLCWDGHSRRAAPAGVGSFSASLIPGEGVCGEWLRRTSSGRGRKCRRHLPTQVGLPDRRRHREGNEPAAGTGEGGAWQVWDHGPPGRLATQALERLAVRLHAEVPTAEEASRVPLRCSDVR